MSNQNGSAMKVFESVLRPAVQFQVGADVFTAAPVCPGKLLVDITKTAALPPEQQLGAMMDFLDAVLVPDSAARYAERFRSSTEPISLDEAVEHVAWLIETYSERPTEPSPSSSNGSAVAAGPSSTGGPVPEDWTLPPSPRIGS